MPSPPPLFTLKLDYCNSLYFSLPKSQINRLHLIQNSLARVVKAPKLCHISPVLKSFTGSKVMNELITSYSLLHTINGNKELCYCRGTARRATSVKILWPFLTELLTRSSANAQEPYEHTVSWNRVKCHTNVRRIAFDDEMMKLPILPCTEKLELVLSTAPEIWKRLQAVNDLQSHSRSLPLLSFDRPYTISY